MRVKALRPQHLHKGDDHLRVEQRQTELLSGGYAGRRAACPPAQRRAVRFCADVGYDRRGIWVDRGCRADFQIGGSNWVPPVRPGVSVLTCPSNDGRRNFCPGNTRSGVRIVRQRSDADCIYGQTWGNDRRQIWVDRGCRADFEVGGGG
jgi:hypothetical protein